MWFLLALLVISLIHYLLVKMNLEKAYFFLPILSVVFLFFGVYVFLLAGKTASADETRNALFLGLPTFALGYDTNYIYKKYLIDKDKRLVCSLSIAIALGITLLQLLEQKLLGINAEGYISSILCTPFFMIFFLALPSPSPNLYENVLGKNLVFYAYIFHAGLGAACDYLGIEGAIKILITIFVSLSLSVLINLLCKLIVNSKRKTAQAA